MLCVKRETILNSLPGVLRSSVVFMVQTNSFTQTIKDDSHLNLQFFIELIERE